MLDPGLCLLVVSRNELMGKNMETTIQCLGNWKENAKCNIIEGSVGATIGYRESLLHSL